MSTRTRLITATAIVVVLMFLWILFAPYWWTNIWWAVRASLWFTLPFILLVVGCIAMGAHVMARDYDRKPTGWIATGYVLLGLLGIGGLVLWGMVHAYLQASTYAEHVQVTDSPVAELGQRAPFQVASAQARPNLGDNPGNLVDTTYQPQNDTYTSLVERQGTFAGYATVLEQHIPLTGRGSGKTCNFSDAADRRIDGVFAGNLGRLIVGGDHRGLNFYDSDAYGYCLERNGHLVPIVVVPLIEQEGWLVVTQKPAGAAIYDGETGTVEVRTDLKGIPGPSYSITLAGMQRESTQAMNGFSNWLWNRTGWETTEDDTNSGNTAEFNLKQGDHPQYVTPLTGRGSATSVSAISTISNVGGDQLNTLSVHRMKPDWVSESAITSRIKADYQDVPNWQNIQIMEIAPLDSTRWVATLGLANGQDVLYRITGTGTLQDQPGQKATCLLRADGSTVRCGTLADQSGNGVGTQYGQGTVQQAAGDLAAMTPQQLADLQKRLSDEITRRLAVK